MDNATTMKALRFGIEIETVGLDRERLARAIQGALGGTVSSDYRAWQVTDAKGRTWRVVPDGSLSGGERSGEIVSPILAYGDIEDLQSLVRAVRTAGARCDDSTSVHVHTDAARFDAKSVTNLVKIVHKQEQLLAHALGINEQRRARYCRPIDEAFMQRLEARRPRTMEQISEAWYGRPNVRPERYHASRYAGLNLNSMLVRGSIEWRLFNGTLHAGEVKAYVQLCLALAAKGLTSKAASSKRREFNVATAKYDFRVFLLGLGMVGDEFKTARLHLTKRLAGSAAWKGERRDRRARSPQTAGGRADEPTEGAQAAE